MGTKQLSTTLLNSVITLKLIIWVRKKKNVRQQETMEWFKYNQWKLPIFGLVAQQVRATDS